MPGAVDESAKFLGGLIKDAFQLFGALGMPEAAEKLIHARTAEILRPVQVDLSEQPVGWVTSTP
jgi:hypothetical protein